MPVYISGPSLNCKHFLRIAKTDGGVWKFEEHDVGSIRKSKPIAGYNGPYPIILNGFAVFPLKHLQDICGWHTFLTFSVARTYELHPELFFTTERNWQFLLWRFRHNYLNIDPHPCIIVKDKATHLYSYN